MDSVRESALFLEKNIVVVEYFLPAAEFAALRAAAIGLVRAKRVHIPWHKRGATVSYHDLLDSAPAISDFYHSRDLLHWCSSVVGEKLCPTRRNDLSSCSLLIYDKAQDHIRAHFDLNFYRGRHFTMLLPLVNTNAAGDGLSSAQLFLSRDDAEVIVPTPPNSFVLFEGAKVRHGVTPLGDGECRIVLSMTYCTDPAGTRAKMMQRRFKDIAYFGLRALWT